MKTLMLLLLAGIAFNSFGNGWLENRPYQFRTPDAKYILILQAQQREISQNGGYKSIYNFHGEVGTFGTTNNYNGQDQIFNNHNATAIGNYSSVSITGDGNNVDGEQDNDQGQNTALGATISGDRTEVGDILSGNGGN